MPEAASQETREELLRLLDRETAIARATDGRLAVLILVVGGFTITSVGVAGLYIGKIFEQVKGRPLFVVSDRIVNGDEL